MRATLAAVCVLSTALTACLATGADERRRTPAEPRASRGTCSPAPPRAPALWRADMEEGSLRDWWVPPGSNAGGGEFDSGSGWIAATRVRRHSGRWGAKLVLHTGSGGARLFRWRELRAHRDVVVSVWLLIPRRYRLTADPATGRFWNVFQFKSRASSGANDPLWFINLATGRRPRLQLVWWHRTLAGPHRGQRGFRRLTQNVAAVPIGRWFRITARLRQSSGFHGVLCVWQDRRLLFRQRGVRTSYRNCAYDARCTSNEWSVNDYSDGMSPSPAVLYVDDARIAAM
jgi:hypothetical protein